MNCFKNFCAVAIAGLVFCTANNVSAQTRHGTLRDVASLNVALEPLDADAHGCGVSELELNDAVQAGAVNAGFTLDGYDYELYLRVSSMPEESLCFSSVDMEVRYNGKLKLPAYPLGNTVRAVLWSNGNIVISPRSQHGGDIAAVVTNLVRGLIADWIKDNSVHKAG